jgi:short-subunit dehydrogenase
LSEQIVVICGASSGVGRETALKFAEAGATVTLAARNEEALRSLEDEVTRLGGTAHVQVTDMAEWPQVAGLAAATVERFGRIDTWINCAANTVYGQVHEVTAEEIERVVQVTMLGQIYGMKAALEQMRPHRSGVIINVASALSVRSAPLQAPYSAAKHGIRGFAESLRMELQHSRMPISVSTLLPSSINTPLFQHARSKMGVLPKPIPPIYQPSVVADAILHAAEHPQAEVVVGGGGKTLDVIQRLAPRSAGWLMLRFGKAVDKQRSKKPDDGTDNLFTPSTGPGSVEGTYGQHAKSTSIYTTTLEQYPHRIRILLGAVSVLGLSLLRRRRG